jgi:hypothetical protein
MRVYEKKMDAFLVHKAPAPKLRIGRPHDGGYMICDLSGSYDCFLGCGISNDISFEQAFLAKYRNIPCFAFDGTIDRLPLADPRICFIKKNIGAHENTEITNLTMFMHAFKDIFIKMDIEGHEFRVLPTFTESNMKKIKQLVLEVHTPADIQLHPDYYKGLHDITNPFLIRLFEKIKVTHTLVHVHPNNACKTHSLEGVFMPNVFECTFVRNDCLTGPRERSTDPIPGPQDMRNMPEKPEMVLAGYPWN